MRQMVGTSTRFPPRVVTGCSWDGMGLQVLPNKEAAESPPPQKKREKRLTEGSLWCVACCAPLHAALCPMACYSMPSRVPRPPPCVSLAVRPLCNAS